MARNESVALGGYYPAPLEAVTLATELLDLGPGEHALFDPCAGEGAAALALGAALNPPPKSAVRLAHVYLCEMEYGRYDRMTRDRYKLRGPTTAVAWGDAFALDLGPAAGNRRGATVEWLNPPYDADREFGRLEERWLRRFGPALAPGGALLFLVPHYALAASVDTLAREFDRLSCWRLPDPHFAAFKQVLVVGRRRPVPLLQPVAAAAARVRAWAESAAELPALAPSLPRLTVPGLKEGEAGFGEFTCRALDLAGLIAELRPWSSTDRRGALAPVAGVVPLSPFADLITRTYPVATPPRPPHIAAGIAAGAYNGASLSSATPGLPAVFVKGAFRRVFVCVEETYSEDGDKTGEVQVQRPRLTINVLDPVAGRYVELRSEVAPTPGDGVPDLGDFTVGDLLKHYGPSLMEVLRRQCPADHDPARDAAPQPPGVARELFTAQRHAVAAVVKLLAKPDRSALVLGELGVGKSSCAAAAFVTHAVEGAVARGARRVLVFCPPHLTGKSWPDQVRACVPRARVVSLDSMASVDAFAADRDPGQVVAVLSRETAKLGHAWRGVAADWRSGLGGLPPALTDEQASFAASLPRATKRPVQSAAACPRCGAPTPRDREGRVLDADALARRRMRCEVVHRVPADASARWAEDLADASAALTLDELAVQLAAPVVQLACARRMAQGPGALPAWDVGRVRPLLTSVAARLRGGWARRARNADPPSVERELYLAVLHAVGDPAFAAREALALYGDSASDVEDDYGRGGTLRELARGVLSLVVDPAARAAAAQSCKDLGADPAGGGRLDHDWAAWERGRVGSWLGRDHLRVDGGRVLLGDAEAGSAAACCKLLTRFAAAGTWTEAPPCGEPLFQADPTPRRYPLAHYVHRQHGRASVPHVQVRGQRRERSGGLPIDFLVLDEAHEAGHAGSAQSLAAMQLINLGLPTVALTGSSSNGYASSLFAILWALSAKFREEYGRDEINRFVKECGYVKRYVEITKGGVEKEVTYGAQTDMRDAGRVTGQAPGVHPGVLLRHLLPVSVPIQLADLECDLPPKREVVVEVDPGQDLLARYGRMEGELRDQIKRDRFTKGLAGKLFGALTEMVSAPDRLSWDSGNAGATRPNAWETRYPEKCPAAGALVTSAAAFPADYLLPKERELIRTLWAERAEGRRVMVFAWHTGLFARLARVIAELTEERVVVLDSAAVNPRVREAWIDAHVVAEEVPFMIVHPKAVQTGLNNLTWFHSVWWHENPACDPIIRRQANARIRRIGQEREARFYTPVVRDTMQPVAMELLLLKQAVSEATDGLDPEASLEAAGVGDVHEAMAGRSVGKALFDLLEQRDAQRGGPGARGGA